MDNSIKNLNLLSIPIVKAYYNLQDTLIYYQSIKIMSNQRDFYTTVFEKAELFLNFNNIDENIKILDEFVFIIFTKNERSGKKI